MPLSAANLPNSLLPANAVTGDGLDCLQRTPPAGQVMVINRFSAPAPAAGAVSQMNCEGSGAAGAQSIAGGVEEFVLRYQLAAPGDPLNPAAAGSGQQRYVNAAAVSNAGTNPQGWAGVTAVEICIVSATPTTSGPAAPGTNALQDHPPDMYARRRWRLQRQYRTRCGRYPLVEALHLGGVVAQHRVCYPFVSTA